jgi:hypothetical protein
MTSELDQCRLLPRVDPQTDIAMRAVIVIDSTQEVKLSRLRTLRHCRTTSCNVLIYLSFWNRAWPDHLPDHQLLCEAASHHLL